jgi:DmsE family decaheme c-type cytochrome
MSRPRPTLVFQAIASPVLLIVLFIAFLPTTAAAEEEAPTGYVGSETCLACHVTLKAAYEKTIHAKVLTEKNGRTELQRHGCEACHGPGQAHLAGGGGKGVGNLVTFRAETSKEVTRENDTCLSCHERGRRVYWKGSPHDSRDVACSSCHTLMKKVSVRYQLTQADQVATCGHCHLIRRAQTFRNAHMPLREGKMECSSCHNPHGTVSQALLPEDSINETCYRCHADKRGPYLWEHAPVHENCTNCHDPHGSTRLRMLKRSLPRLCQQCHIGTLHITEARNPRSRFVIGRSCLNCHLNIHGSNHPSGHLFLR